MRSVYLMRISDFRIHSIAMAAPPLRSSYGLHQPYALRNVIELESDDGVIGIAETYGGDQPARASQQVLVISRVTTYGSMLALGRRSSM